MLDFIARHHAAILIAMCLTLVAVAIGLIVGTRRYGKRFLGTALVVLMLALAYLIYGYLSTDTDRAFRPKRFREATSNEDLILFIHGWNGDPLLTWEQFPTLIASDPRFDSCDIISVDYPTYIRKTSPTPTQLTDWLRSQLATKAPHAPYKRIFVVAHSFGGLIARNLVIQSRLGGDNDAYKLLVEIATPHRGAEVAKVATLINRIGLSPAYAMDLQENSPFLLDLKERWNALNPRPDTIAIAGLQDGVVSRDSATDQCDRHCPLLPECDHIDIAKPTDSGDDRYWLVADQIANSMRGAKTIVEVPRQSAADLRESYFAQLNAMLTEAPERLIATDSFIDEWTAAIRKRKLDSEYDLLIDECTNSVETETCEPRDDPELRKRYNRVEGFTDKQTSPSPIYGVSYSEYLKVYRENMSVQIGDKTEKYSRWCYRDFVNGWFADVENKNTVRDFQNQKVTNFTPRVLRELARRKIKPAIDSILPQVRDRLTKYLDVVEAEYLDFTRSPETFDKTKWDRRYLQIITDSPDAVFGESMNVHSD